MSHAGESGNSFMEGVAAAQTDKDRKKFDVAQKSTVGEKFTSPTDLSEQQRKNLAEALVGVAKVDALVNLGKLAKEHNPDSALTRYLSSSLTELARRSLELDKNQKEGHAKEHVDNDLRNIASLVELTLEGLTNPDEQIAHSRKILERNRPNTFPGAEEQTQRNARTLQEYEEIKRDLDELFGADGMEKLKQLFGKEASASEE